MSVRRILQLGDPLLRAISMPVDTPEEAAEIFIDLRDTLHEFQRTRGFGRGISAIQISETKRLIYIEFDGRAYSLRNPVYEMQSEEKFALWDDCFSFPELLVWLKRSQIVRVRYEDEHGATHIIEATGALSELLQHEIDHMDGILAVDRALGRDAFCTRTEYARRHGITLPAAGTPAPAQ
jgi:peptide deformylase